MSKEVETEDQIKFKELVNMRKKLISILIVSKIE